MEKDKVKVVKKADVLEQKVEVYWKEYNDKTLLAVKVTKGSKVVVVYKDPKYLKELRDHLQTIAKFGLRRNII